VEKRTKKILTGLLISGFLFFAFIVYISISSISTISSSLLVDDSEYSDDKNAQIAVVEADGAIMDSQKIIDNLIEAERNKDIKAIILRVNSPGGAVAPVQEIYEEIVRIDKIKPVYASMATVAASGGYYISAACRKIFASAGTLTGSIGVIISLVDLSKLYDFAKISVSTIKAGKYKDAGNPARPLTEEERKKMQSTISDVHQQFVKDIVAKRQALIKRDIDELAQGQIFSGKEALDYGLIDSIGSLWSAGREIHKELNLKGDFGLRFIKKRKGFSLFDLTDRIEDALTPINFGNLINESLIIMYKM